MRKENVLHTQKEFDLIYRKGRSVPDRYVVVFFRKGTGLPYGRRAFLASKKVGNAVHRNRARRLMKESLRLSGIEIPAGTEVIFIARNTINGATCGEVQRSMISALRRARIVKKK